MSAVTALQESETRHLHGGHCRLNHDGEHAAEHLELQLEKLLMMMKHSRHVEA